MTPDAYQTTINLDSALANRVAGEWHVIHVNPLKAIAAADLIYRRVRAARSVEISSNINKLFPFPDRVAFSRRIYSNPRRLVKTCFFAIADADNQTTLPFSKDYLLKIEDQIYPILTSSGQ